MVNGFKKAPLRHLFTRTIMFSQSATLLAGACEADELPWSNASAQRLKKLHIYLVRFDWGFQNALSRRLWRQQM